MATSIEKVSSMPESNVLADGDFLYLVQVQGGGSFLPRKLAGSRIVKTAGNQTIEDVKTFTSSPIVPGPTTANQAANKTYVDASGNPPGVVLPYAAATAPSGYLLCDGSEVSRTTYAALFGVLSTLWGAGNGTTTFNVPDMRAASPAGAGTSVGYATNETLTLGTKYDDQLQVHIHQMSIFTASNNGAFQGYFGGTNNGGTQIFNTGDVVNARTGTVTRGKVVALNYIIKT